MSIERVVAWDCEEHDLISQGDAGAVVFEMDDGSFRAVTEDDATYDRALAFAENWLAYDRQAAETASEMAMTAAAEIDDVEYWRNN